MIQPTIGRHVLLFNGSLAAPNAAIIAHVHNERMVNVAAFDPEGRHYSVVNVTLLQEDTPVPTEGVYATWVPIVPSKGRNGVHPVLD